MHGRKDCAGKCLGNGKHKKSSYAGRMAVFLCFVFFLGLFRGWMPGASAEEEPAETVQEETKRSTIKFDPTVAGTGYLAVLYDNENGLPTSEANAIAETSDGFLWIGSYSGLIRYDGNTFLRMDSTTGIASVVCLYVDSKDRLWVGTNDAGVAVIERNKTRYYRMKDGMTSDTIRGITEAADGSIYIAMAKGIARINTDMDLQIVDHYVIKGQYIRDISTGADGVVYGLTQKGEIFTLVEKGQMQGYQYVSKLGIDEVISSIFPDPDAPGYVYLGTEESMIYRVNITGGTEDMEAYDVSPLVHINSMSKVGGSLWVCADNGGTGVLDGSHIRILQGSPLTNSIENVHQDYAGNLWFASSSQGVMKVVPNRFTNVLKQYRDELKQLGVDDEKIVVNSACVYRNRVLLGTENGLLVLNNSGKLGKLFLEDAVDASGKPIDARELVGTLYGVRIRSVIRDSKDRVWISTYSDDYGLIRYYNGHAVFFKKSDGMPSSRIRTIRECADGSILVACTGGVVRIVGDEIKEIYNESYGVENTEVLTVEEGVNGEILIGTDGDGIYVIDGEETRHYGTADGLNSGVIMRIKKDSTRDIYWIVTSNSLAFADANMRIQTIQQFPYSNNFDLYINSKDEVWIMSSNGIYVASAAEMLKNGEFDTIYFGRENGLPCIPMSNSYSDLTEDGDLYIACSKGVAKVNIERAFDAVEQPKAAVSYIEAEGVIYYPEPDGSFVIPANVKKLTIHCHIFNYSLINPVISYRLKGVEKNYKTMMRSELVPLDYTNLRGGIYYFEMHMIDILSDTKTDISVKITKEKAFYETYWFRLMAASATFGLAAWIIFLYVRRKIRKYVEREKQQQIFITEMIEAFAKTIDMKDRYTNGHSFRVADYTSMLAKELGYSDEDVIKYHRIALLHDIGKIGVPAAVLNKQGKLTDEEFAIIKSHSSRGYNVLKDISIMPELAIGAAAHHERPDGKGYPKGLKGDEIPRVAQIIAVADTFDAMYSDRPYRKRMNFEKAVSIIRDGAGTQLEKDVVEAFLRLVDRGEFRAPDDVGGGTTEDINNIHKTLNKGEAAEKKAEEAETKPAEELPKKDDAEAVAKPAEGADAEAPKEPAADEEKPAGEAPKDKPADKS